MRSQDKDVVLMSAGRVWTIDWDRRHTGLAAESSTVGWKPLAWRVFFRSLCQGYWVDQAGPASNEELGSSQWWKAVRYTDWASEHLSSPLHELAGHKAFRLHGCIEEAKRLATIFFINPTQQNYFERYVTFQNNCSKIISTFWMIRGRCLKGSNNYCVFILFGDGWGFLNRG